MHMAHTVRGLIAAHFQVVQDTRAFVSRFISLRLCICVE